MKRAAAALSEQQKNDLIELLEARFASHPERHATIAWPEVHARIDGNEDALRSLYLMERTEGEPDVIGMDVVTGKAVFVDCSPESPLGRRNLCYDRAALEGRKKNKPSGNAVDEARAMGIEGCKRSVNSIGKHRVGSRPRRASGISAVRCSATVGTTRCSFITTVPIRTTVRAVSAGCGTFNSPRCLSADGPHRRFFFL